MTELLDQPTAVTGTIAAQRLLERLDAHVAREHPVDVEYVENAPNVPHAAIVIANVTLEDDVPFTVTLRRDQTIDLDRDLDPLLALDEAENLGHALLRLVAIARNVLSAESTQSTQLTQPVPSTEESP